MSDPVKLQIPAHVLEIELGNDRKAVLFIPVGLTFEETILFATKMAEFMQSIAQELGMSMDTNGIPIHLNSGKTAVLEVPSNATAADLNELRVELIAMAEPGVLEDLIVEETAVPLAGGSDMN